MMRSRRTRRRRIAGASLGTATLLLLALGGCEFFTETAFPEYAPSIQARQSLAQYIGSSEARVRMTATPELDESTLFLIVEEPAKPERLLIIDEDLDVMKDYTEAELNSQLGGSGGTFGTTSGFDLAGRPVIGNFVFDQDTYEPVIYNEEFSSGTLPATDQVLTVRFDEDEPAENRIYMLSTSSGQLNIDYYQQLGSSPYHWDNRGTAGGNIGSAGPYSIPAVFPVDFDGVGTALAIAFWDQATSEVSVILFLYDPLDSGLNELPATGIPPWSTTLIEDRRVWPPIKNVQEGGVYIASGGWVVRNEDSNTYRLIDGDTGGKKSTFDGLDDMDHEIAFPYEASFYYVFDYEDRVLYRMSNWWN